jgi:Flp pilus assembly protein TadD
LVVDRRMWAVSAFSLCVFLSGCATMNNEANQVNADGSAKMTEADMQLLLMRGEQSLAYGEVKSAENIYSKVVSAYPDNPQVWFRIGTSYLRAQQPDLAVVALREASRLDPKMNKAWSNLAIAYLEQFRGVAVRVIANDQTNDTDRITLKSLLADVDHAVVPAKTEKPAPSLAK